MKTLTFAKILGLIIFAANTASANSSVATLENMAGLSLVVAEGLILSNCGSDEKVCGCKDAADIRISEQKKMYHQRAIEVLQADQEDLVAAKQNLFDLELQIQKTKAENNTVRLDLAQKLADAQAHYKNLTTIAKNQLRALNTPLYSTIDFDGYGRFENSIGYVNGQLGSQSVLDVNPVNTKGAKHQISLFKIQYHPSMKMKMLITIGGESMIARCRQINVNATLLNVVDIPFTDRVEVKCSLPNYRGYVNFKVK